MNQPPIDWQDKLVIGGALVTLAAFLLFIFIRWIRL